MKGNSLCSDVRKAYCFLDINECSSKTSAQKLRARYSTWLMLFFFHEEHLTLGTDVQMSLIKTGV